jgi:tetratricopeptide (TPR) repeat protein
MKKYITISFFVINGVVACKSQSKPAQNQEMAIKLNNKAISLSSRNMGDIDSVTKALKTLNEAILADSTYYTAYVNKVSILCTLGYYNDMLNTLIKIEKFDKNKPELFASEGYILEKLGRFAEADIGMPIAYTIK